MRCVIFKKLLKCQSGVTAIEFAFVAPVLILFMMGIIEFSLVMYISAIMESATTNSSRFGKTGYVAEGSSRQDQMVTNILSRTGGLLRREDLTVSTMVYSGFENINQPEPYTDTNHNDNHDNGEPYTDVNGNGQWDADMGSAGLGNAGDIVVYTVNYPWHIMTPLMQQFLGTTFTLSARTVVKNEPYNQ